MPGPTGIPSRPETRAPSLLNPSSLGRAPGVAPRPAFDFYSRLPQARPILPPGVPVPRLWVGDQGPRGGAPAGAPGEGSGAPGVPAAPGGGGDFPMGGPAFGPSNPTSGSGPMGPLGGAPGGIGASAGNGTAGTIGGGFNPSMINGATGMPSSGASVGGGFNMSMLAQPTQQQLGYGGAGSVSGAGIPMSPMGGGGQQFAPQAPQMPLAMPPAAPSQGLELGDTLPGGRGPASFPRPGSTWANNTTAGGFQPWMLQGLY